VAEVIGRQWFDAGLLARLVPLGCGFPPAASAELRSTVCSPPAISDPALQLPHELRTGGLGDHFAALVEFCAWPGRLCRAVS
jgi:hypothetical protein